MSTPTFKNLSSLVEQPDSRSREWTRDGGLIETRIYVAEYDVAVAGQKSPYTVGTGDLTGFIIRSSTVQAMRPLLGKLVDVWQAGGEDGDPEANPLPSDTVSVSGTNQSPKTERHPRYISLASIAGELGYVEDALRGATPTKRDDAYAELSALGQELVDKIRAGNESFYMASLRYSWTSYYYTAPTMYRGGWVEPPGGPLAGYFVGSISWLREADDLNFDGNFWQLTRNWLGGPNGSWDNQLYPV